MKKSKLSIIVLSALLIAGVAVVKNQNCKSIVYNNVEALTGGDNGNEPQTHQVCRYTKGITQNEPSWFFKNDKDGNYTGYSHHFMIIIRCKIIIAL